MNKSPQYNQQSKSNVEEIRIYENMESGRHSIGKIRQGQLHCTDAGKILLLKQSWIGYTNHTPAAWYLYIAQEGRQMEAFAM